MPMTVIDIALPAIIVASAARMLLRMARVPCPYLNVFAGLAGFAALVPVGSSSLGGVYLSIFGTPSAATIVLAATAAAVFVSDRFASARSSTTFAALVFALGLLLYPMTAGLTVFDPYDLGFRGWEVAGLMVLACLVAWRFAARDATIWIGLAALLYLARTGVSLNIWDYVIDPFAFLAAAGILMRRGIERWRAPGRLALSDRMESCDRMEIVPDQ